MPSGACVIRREGKRGVVVWSVKYRDADGRQVKERLGRDADGWTERKAKAELEARLTDVRREGRRKPPLRHLRLGSRTNGLRPTPTQRG